MLIFALKSVILIKILMFTLYTNDEYCSDFSNKLYHLHYRSKVWGYFFQKQLILCDRKDIHNVTKYFYYIYIYILGV